MKLLKLTNTPECLKLAECLIGNPLLSRRGKEVLTHGRCGLDFMDSWGHFSRELSIYETKDFKLEDLKVCPYMAMKNRVMVNAKWNNGEIKECSITEIATCKTGAYISFEDWKGCKEEGLEPTLTLDLTNLPKGASIIKAEVEV